jgi:phosphatidylglycerol:prolipoprotein diacylglycerol transferase
MFYIPTIIQINLGFMTIQVWGLLAACAVLMGLVLTLRRAKKENIESGIIWDVVTLALLGMLAGGRFLYFLALPNRQLADLIGIGGGFSFLGGALLGGFLVYTYLAYKRQDIWKLLDLSVSGFIIALIITRLGCLLVDDHIGKLTVLPWGKVFSDGTIRHPVTLYEIIFLIALFFAISRLRQKLAREGSVFFLFIAGYSVFRLVIDFFRCDDLEICDARFYSLTPAQWLSSLLLGVAGVWLQAHRRHNNCLFEKKEV